jgi:outer membrane PBP1 activator LpoA protein
MRPSFPQYRKLFQAASLVAIAACLSACGGSPAKPATVTEPGTENPGITKGPVLLPESEYSPQFRVAEGQLLAFDWMGASRSLSDIPTDQINSTDYQYRIYLQARIHYVKGEQAEAELLMQQLKQSAINPAIAAKVDNFLRHILSMSGRELDSAQLGNQMLAGLAHDPLATDALRRSIWRNLQMVSAPELRLALETSTDRQWRGWLELSLVTAEFTTEPALQASLNRWRDESPGHPAALALPGGLGELLDQPASLQGVALMLPLSDRLAPAAKAVRDGYLSSYYAAEAANSAAYELQIIDTDRYASVVQAYEEAVGNGANLVIGPLSKNDVAALGGHPNRQVPVMALNRVEEMQPQGNIALIQLALAPEDEARQIAELAFGQGARRAVVIRPGGTWGVKMEQALVDRWQSLGGQLGSVATYSSQEDYSSSMAAALNLHESEQRARDVRSMLATNIEFTARRRQDLDVVFMLSRSDAEARSIKPLLAYHYASELPVYATSSIYGGAADNRDKDLNGVHLVEIPWLLGAKSSLRTAVGNEGNYARLYALGADAFLLQSRFRQLQAGPDVQIRGHTGLLSLDSRLRIQRELQPATFGGGVLNAQ